MKLTSAKGMKLSALSRREFLAASAVMGGSLLATKSQRQSLTPVPTRRSSPSRSIWR